MAGTVVADGRHKVHRYVYFTADGGTHWSVADTPLRDPKWIVVADATHWWAGNSSEIVMTSDAGAEWAAIHPNVEPNLDFTYRNVPALQFTSPSDGWALNDGNPTGSNTILQTTDGGHTWAPVQLPTGSG